MIIFSAPSGSGKSTIVHHLIKKYPSLEFSVSATSRDPRGVERDGVDYYFVSQDEFRRMIGNDELIEWEEVYSGVFYGTKKSEIERICGKGNTVIFDIDVKGGINLKKMFGKDALSIFIMPPSIEELRNRLVGRGTDKPEFIEQRLAKASVEIADAKEFDEIIINDNLDAALKQAEEIVGKFIGQ